MAKTKTPHLLIVEARFYDDMSDALLDGTKSALDLAGATYDVVTVPGALEIPPAIAIALDAMDERFKVPFLMVLLLGVSCREVAQELAVPLGTVLSRVHRARQFLRQRLGETVAGQSNVVSLRGRKS